MPETWMTRVDRITSDLLSGLLDYETEPDETWDDWVEMLMNEAWDALRKVDPDA